jgi:hypothetical protein
MGQIRNALIGSMHRWEDNIRMVIGWEVVDCINLADQWQAVVNTVMELSGSINGGEFLD